MPSSESFFCSCKPSLQLDPETDFPKHARPGVLVAEVFDTMVIGEGALDTFEHARRYLLAPGAALIPGKAVLYGGLVESERLWQEGGANQASGFDLVALNRFRPNGTDLSRITLVIARNAVTWQSLTG